MRLWQNEPEASLPGTFSLSDVINFPRCLSRRAGRRRAHGNSPREEACESGKTGPGFGKTCAIVGPPGLCSVPRGGMGMGGALTPKSHAGRHACPRAPVRRPGGDQRIGRAGLFSLRFERRPQLPSLGAPSPLRSAPLHGPGSHWTAPRGRSSAGGRHARSCL